MSDQPDSLNLGSSLLTIERFRWVMGYGETEERGLRRRREIDHFRKGKVVRYTPAAVLEFIARHTVRAKRPAVSMVPRPAFTAEDWQRIERLIADQVAQRLAAAPSRTTEGGLDEAA